MHWNHPLTACITTSIPPSWPAHVWSGPASFWTSFFNTIITHFPIIRLNISPIPIGLRPGHLSKATSLPAVSTAIDLKSTSSVHTRLANLAIALATSSWDLLKVQHYKMCCQHSESTSVGPPDHDVSLAAFFTNIESMASKITSSTATLSPVIRISSAAFIAEGCFSFSCLITVSSTSNSPPLWRFMRLVAAETGCHGSWAVQTWCQGISPGLYVPPQVGFESHTLHWL